MTQFNPLSPGEIKPLSDITNYNQMSMRHSAKDGKLRCKSNEQL